MAKHAKHKVRTQTTATVLLKKKKKIIKMIKQAGKAIRKATSLNPARRKK